MDDGEAETDLVSNLIKIPFSSWMTELLKSSCINRGGWILSIKKLSGTDYYVFFFYIYKYLLNVND